MREPQRAQDSRSGPHSGPLLTLALDTTTKTSSCAVARDGIVLCEQAGDGSKPQAERLPGDLIALLAHAGLSLADIDLFAVATGPGSFTGLRIGIATMQGLAFATGKPLVGVSGFDALAHVIFRLPAFARSALRHVRRSLLGGGGKPEATAATLYAGIVQVCLESVGSQRF
jgi:tRNA threonylcarbamoyl adenosine modification protein YeaZ